MTKAQDTTYQPDETLFRSAAIAIAVGGAILAPDGAQAQNVSNVDQPLPATIYFNGDLQFTFDSGTDTNIVAVGNNLIAPNGATAAKLNAGATIDAGLFSGATGTLSEFSLKSGTYYVGLDVNVSPGVDYYGWASVINTNSGTNSPPTDVTGYAFQSQANTAINAGDMPIPEPVSLSLLASGVAGVAAIRRRRQPSLR